MDNNNGKTNLLLFFYDTFIKNLYCVYYFFYECYQNFNFIIRSDEIDYDINLDNVDINNKIIINNSNKNQIVIGAVMHVNMNILSIVIYNYL